MCADYRKAADLVSALFDGMMNKEMNQSMSFIRGWKSVVGDKLAAHSKIIDLDRGSIIVEVDHSGWSQQILLQKKRILLLMITFLNLVEKVKNRIRLKMTVNLF